MDRYLLKPISDEDFKDLYNYFVSHSCNLMSQRATAKGSFLGTYCYETDVFNPFKLTEKQGKALVDWCVDHNDREKLISFFNSGYYVIKVPYSVLQYYFDRMLACPKTTEIERYYMLHYSMSDYFEANTPLEKKISACVQRLYHDYRDKLEFSDLENLKAYVEHLAQFELQYKDYAPVYIYNCFVNELADSFVKRGLLNAKDFYMEDNLKEYLK